MPAPHRLPSAPFSKTLAGIYYKSPDTVNLTISTPRLPQNTARWRRDFDALAAVRREEAEKADTPSRQHELLDGADTWERSARYLDAKARVFASFALRPVRSA